VAARGVDRQSLYFPEDMLKEIQEGGGDPSGSLSLVDRAEGMEDRPQGDVEIPVGE